jgi:hypothetical protein
MAERFEHLDQMDGDSSRMLVEDKLSRASPLRPSTPYHQWQRNALLLCRKMVNAAHWRITVEVGHHSQSL